MPNNVPGEDISFSLGLSAAGLIAEMERTEPATKASLDRIAGHFIKFKKDVEGATNFDFKLTQQMKGMASAAKEMGTQFNVVRDNLRQLKRLLTDPMNAKGMRAEMQEMVRMQRESVKLASVLRQSMGSTPRPAAPRAPAAPRPATMGLPGRTLSQEVQQFGGIVRNLSTLMSVAGIGGGVFALIYGFKQLVAEGIRFNAELERAKISIASVTVASAEEVRLNDKKVTGMEAVYAVQQDVGKIVKELRLDSLFVVGTFEDMVQIATALVGPVLRTGKGLEDVRKLTRATGIAASVLGVELKSATTGMLQLMNGRVVPRNDLVKKLPFNAVELNQAIKDPTQRVEKLLELLNRVNVGAPLLLTSYKAVAESVRDLLQQTAGSIFQPLQERLQAAYNSVVKKTVDQSGEQKSGFTAGAEAQIRRFQKLVEGVMAMISQNLGEMFSGKDIDTFFEALRRSLPGIVDGFFTLFKLIKDVSTVMLEHSAAVGKALKYYLGFQVVVGLFNSFNGVVRNLNNSFASVSNFVVAAYQRMRLAADDGMTATKNAFGAVTRMRTAAPAVDTVTMAFRTLKTTLMSLLSTTVIGLILVGLGELVSSLINAKQESERFTAAFNDINNVKFDGAIAEIERVHNKMREGRSLWQWFTGQTGTQDVTKVTALLGQSRSAMIASAAKAGIPFQSNSYRTLPGGAVEPLIEDYQTGAAAVAKRAEARKALLKADPKDTARVAELQRTIDFATHMIELLRDIPALKADVDKREAALKSAPTASFTTGAYGPAMSMRVPAPAVKTYGSMLNGYAQNDSYFLDALDSSDKTSYKGKAGPVEDTSKQRGEFLDKALAAIREFGNDSVREYEKQLTAKQAVWNQEIAERKKSIQQAGKEELAAIEQTSADELQQRKDTFEEMRTLMTKGGVWKELTNAGVGGTFDQFQQMDSSQFSQMIKDFTLSHLNETDDTKRATQEQTITRMKQLQDLFMTLEADRLSAAQKIAKTKADIANAEERADQLQADLNAKLEEARSAAELESAQQQDITNSLDEQISRAKALGELDKKHAIATIDKQAEAERKALNSTSLTEEERLAALSAINDAAELRRKAAIAKADQGFLQTQISLMEKAIGLRETDLTIRESELELAKLLHGSDSPGVILSQNKLYQARSTAAGLKATSLDLQAKLADDNGQRTQANDLRLAAKGARVEQSKYSAMIVSTLQIVGTQIEKLGGYLGKFNSTLGEVVSGIGGMFGTLDQFRRSGGFSGMGQTYSDMAGSVSKALGGGKAGKAAGSVAGGIAVAGQALQIIGPVLGVLSGIAGASTQKAIDKITKSAEQFSDSISQIVDNLRNHNVSLKDAIAQLEYARTTTGQSIKHERVSWLSSLFGGASAADKAYEDAVAAANKAIDEQLKTLRQNAQDAVKSLVEDLLPSLRPNAAVRDFATQIHDLAKQIKELSETPGVSQADINELFNLKIADTYAAVQDQILTERKNYVDILKQEKDLQQSMLDIEDQRLQLNEDYTAQRNKILGISTRELSETEQLAALDKQHAKDLAALDKQKADAVEQLASVEKQKQTYIDTFGVISDIGAYQIETEDTLMKKQTERLSALVDFFRNLPSTIGEGSAAFISQTPGWVAPPLPPPPPLANWGHEGIGNPSLEAASRRGPTQVFNMHGDISVNGNMSRSEVLGAFRDSWRAVLQDNTSKGLAFGNA